MKKIVSIVLLSLCAFLSVSAAETRDEDVLQRRIKEVAKTLRCTVCQSESVWESNAELAAQMRGVIRERLLKGESPDEIRAYFLSRYGDYILLEPRKRGLNWLLWGGPFLLLVMGGSLLYRTLRRWVSQTVLSLPEELPPIDERSRQRIEQELLSLENRRK